MCKNHLADNSGRLGEGGTAKIGLELAVGCGRLTLVTTRYRQGAGVLGFG